MAHQQLQVGDALGDGLDRQQRRGGGGGFEAHRQKHHAAIGMVAGDGQHVEWCVDDPHRTAAGPHAEQVAAIAAGHTQHVAVGAEDHLRLAGEGDRPIELFRGGDTYRAAGAVDEADLRWQQPVDAMAQQRVGLAAAHLHQRPGLVTVGSDLLEQSFGFAHDGVDGVPERGRQ